MKTASRGNAKHGISKPHPRPQYANKIELYQFRRGPDNPTWDARFKIDGAWSGWASLGTTQWDDAIFVSIDRLNEREHAAKHGLPIPNARPIKEANRVAEIAVTTLARLRGEQARVVATKEAKKAHVFTAKISCIESRLLPAFGDRGIASLTEDDMERFRLALRVGGDRRKPRPLDRQPSALTDVGEWASQRIADRQALVEAHVPKPDRKPKRSTLANTNSAWLEILRDAIDAGYISRARKKMLVISQEGFEKGARGESFSREEMEMIRRHMSPEWVAAGHTQIIRENRFLLRMLISLMATTGITPGLEVETLTPAQVAPTRDHNGHMSVRIAIRGHQGKRAPSRVVWARITDVWPVVDDMQRLRAWTIARATPEYEKVNPNRYLFCRPSDGAFPIFHRVFEEVLETLGMRRDPVTGINRRLYSCRHYYATQALQDGVDVTYVAKNMGTSERMIHDHYSHVITDLRSGILTGSQMNPPARTDAQLIEDRKVLDRIDNDPDDHLSPEDGYYPVHQTKKAVALVDW